MTLDKIKDLYLNKKLSTSEIGNLLGISQWTVISFMRRNNIQRRTPAETLKIKFAKSPLSYNQKHILTVPDEKLKIAGLMLYWGEGAKARYGIVDFANCDKKMVYIFLEMLRRIYRVDEKRLRLYLYCYNNQDVNKLIDYWTSKLNISKSQLTKPYVKNNFDITKTNKMPYGLIHVRYNDKRLQEQILKDIDIIASRIR